MSEQSDGVASHSEGTNRVRSDEAREVHETAPTGNADRRALADALRFLESSDDPEPFAGQFDPFDGFRTEREQDRSVRSAAPADPPSSDHPPSWEPDENRPNAAGSISAAEIERLEQEMMAIDASWGGCEPEPVPRVVGKQSDDSSRPARDGKASGDAMPIDAEGAPRPQSNQSESASDAAGQPAGAESPHSGGCDSEMAVCPTGNIDLDAACGRTLDSRSGGKDHESREDALPGPRSLNAVLDQPDLNEGAPSGSGNGGEPLEPSTDEECGDSDPDSEVRAFDEVGARMAIRDDAETGSRSVASCGATQERGAPSKVGNETREANQESESGLAAPQAQARAIPREVEAGPGASDGAIEDSEPELVDRADPPLHRPASGLPAKAAAILAAGVAVSACMLAFDRFDIASMLKLGQIQDGGEDSGRHGIREMRGELDDSRKTFPDTAGTPSIPDSSAARAISAQSLANSAVEASRSSGESLESVAGADADGKTDVVEHAAITGPAARRGGPWARSGTGSADVNSFPVTEGLGRDADDDVNDRATPAVAEAKDGEFGPPFGFFVAGNHEVIRSGSGRTEDSHQHLPVQPVPVFDPAVEGCVSDCEIPEAHPSIAAQQPQAAAALKLIAAGTSIRIGSRLESTARQGLTGAVGGLDGLSSRNPLTAPPGNTAASGSGAVAEGGVIEPAVAPADANERISRDIAALRAETDDVARSLRSRISFVEAKLEEFGKARTFELESRDRQSAMGKAKNPGNGPYGTRAGMADELRSGAAIRSNRERAETYVIATEFRDDSCSGTRPSRKSPGTEGFGCGRVLDVVNDGFGGWLVVTENAVIRLD